MKVMLFVLLFGTAGVSQAQAQDQAQGQVEAQMRSMLPKQVATDPRVVDRAMMEPEFFELAVTDPELAAVVAAARIPFPLPDDPKTRDSLRKRFPFIPPPPPANAIWEGGENPWKSPPPRLIVPPPGQRGNQIRLMKADDLAQRQAAELFQSLPAPERRVACFQKIMKGGRIGGWQLDIHEAKTVGRVTTVKIQAYPILETPLGGETEMSVGSVVNETYEVRGGKPELVKFEPEGLHFQKRR